MPDGVRIRNRRGQGERLRDEIINAAQALVDESSNPASVTLRAIARRAGISTPSIYAHFADLQVIADAVLERCFAELDKAVAQAMTDAVAPDARLIAGCLAYVRFGWEHRARYRFMIGGQGFAPDAVATFRRVERALSECVNAGLSSSKSPQTDIFLLWVGMHGMATLEKPNRVELRRLGTLDRIALTELLVRRIVGLPALAAPE
jgi:AcrR family transcriptional regulator